MMTVISVVITEFYLLDPVISSSSPVTPNGARLVALISLRLTPGLISETFDSVSTINNLWAPETFV